MQQALSVFINGLLGVFVGMAVLYVTIKLISLACERGHTKTEKDKT